MLISIAQDWPGLPRSGYNDSTKSPILSLKALNPGSGGEIPAIWHGTGACHGHIYPKILVLNTRLSVLQCYPERGYPTAIEYTLALNPFN